MLRIWNLTKNRDYLKDLDIAFERLKSSNKKGYHIDVERELEAIVKSPDYKNELFNKIFCQGVIKCLKFSLNGIYLILILYYFELILAWMSVKSQYRDKTKKPFLYHDSTKIYVNQDNCLFINVNDKGIQPLENSLELYKNNKMLQFNLYESIFANGFLFH